jgi:antitoxin component YwqK of YwqJK toxin-antitoxin module
MLAKLMYHHDAGFRVINKDTLIWIKRKECNKNNVPIETANSIILYSQYVDSLKPISIINDKKIVIETFYTNGEEKIGPYVKYYDNGIIKVKGTYSSEKYFKKLGQWSYYDKNGVLKETKNYK